MDISGISSGMTPNINQNLNLAKIRADYDALTSAIDGGDLSTAQTAYNTLKADTVAGGKLPGSDLLAIGSALQAGDISMAQQALSQMRSNQQAIQAALNAEIGPDIEQLLFGDNSGDADNGGTTSTATAANTTDILDLSVQQSADQVSAAYTKEDDGSYLA